MKALTLTQPWASLVAIGAKQVETRSWHTSYRGPLAIHAAKGFPYDTQNLCYSEPFLEALRPVMPEPFLHTALPKGCIIAICDLVHIVRVEAGAVNLREFQQQLAIDEKEYAFGDYTPGRFAWLLHNVHALPEPIAAKGSLGLWNWEEN